MSATSTRFGVATALYLATGCVRAVVTFAGPLHPVSGACNPVSRAELTVRGNDVLFVPTSGTIILHGARAGELLTAQSVSTGADHKPYTLTFKGHLSDGTVEGVYDSPRCRYTVMLRSTGS